MEKYRKKIDRLLARRKMIKQQGIEEKKHLRDFKITRKGLIEGRKILQTLAAEMQHQAHRRVAEIVNRCLAAVFDDPYEFEILFERKRNRTEATFILCRDGIKLDKPTKEAGGGVIDIASLALRIAALALQTKHERFLLMLDEPFKWVSEGYRPYLKAMIEQLEKELGFQFIIVTQLPDLQIGKVIHLGDMK